MRTGRHTIRTTSLIVMALLGGQVPLAAGFVLCVAPDHVAVEAAAPETRAAHEARAAEQCKSTMHERSGCVDFPLSFFLYSALHADSPRAERAAGAMAVYHAGHTPTGDAGNVHCKYVPAAGPPFPSLYATSVVLLI